MTGLTNRVYIKCNGNGRLYMKVTTNDPKLATPQNVSASGTTVSWSAVTNATSYKIFAGSTNIATTTSISYNLTNSAGWTSLSDGNHNITIVAKADGYLDSEHSSAVVVTKATTPTEDELAGTWTFNERLNLSAEEYPENTSFEFRFYTEYDGMEYSVLSIDYLDEQTGEYSGMLYDDVQVYGLVDGEPIWENADNRTITITSLLDELPNGQDVLAFMQMNATKKNGTGATLISFTIGGDSYQAEEGMTWAQWVDSSYNPGGKYMNLDTWIGNQFGQSVAIKSGKFATDVSPSDTIQEGTAYVLQTGVSSPN